ncbi:uncharacterized protein BCR38DRAFT_434011 [Pseudomassariella vexata]|uniref:DUF7704 domain-containing protein n=1 Tax=Pseudomassariella vexata TaxID=1141098 RepID=A0A1Y2DXS7_9PEZI|nr:uncharacterized protein BCR38DRAFT_434011 [Pseudomassariella vexata]ORY64102.1 hypothetical protein BCR38DRAFT_434011 [Pseudomassariella vexata]
MSTIPLPYLLVFHYVEPLFATLGALQALLSPGALVHMSLPSISYTPALRPLFTQLAGSWLMFAFHDAVTLRIYRDDVRIWRHILGAAILSDVGYTASLVQSMGWEWFLNPLRWDLVNGFTILSTVGPLVAKVLFVLGVGVPGDRKLGKKGRKKE